METLLQDIRFGLRQLRATPGHSLVAILTLAVGIGAATAIFAVVDPVLLRPLPFPEPERLVSTGESHASYPDLLDWRAAGGSFRESAIYSVAPWPLDLTSGERPERIQSAAVSTRFLDVLGVRPVLGRTFSGDESEVPRQREAVVSHGFWVRRLGASPEAIGRELTLSGNVFTVVGVMPEGFAFPPHETDLWTPILALLPEAAEERGLHAWRGVARLPAGTTPTAAATEMDALSQRLEERNPVENADLRWTAVPLSEAISAGVRPGLLVLLAAVGFLLLVTCASVAGLLLARAAARSREMGLRRAIGAGRGRLARQLLTESVLLSLIGGLSGVLLAWWGTHALGALAAADLPPGTDIAIDLRVLGFAIAVSVATGVVFGVVPAVQSVRESPAGALRASGRGATGGPGRARFRRALTVAQVALALVLLAGAGLLVRSLLNLQAVPPGFRPAHLLTFHVSLSPQAYPEVPEQVAFYREVVDRLRGLPGVTAAAAFGDLPLVDDMYAPHNVAFEGRAVPAEEEPDIASRPVTPEGFEALGVPVVRGRGFTAADAADAEPVAVVNEALVRRYFPGEDPLGRRLRWSRSDDVRWMRIVGVVGDVKHFALDEDEEPAIYTPHAQAAVPWRRMMTVVARTSGDPLRLARAAEREVWAVDPDVPIASVRTMEGWISDGTRRARVQALLLAVFAGVALLLAALGVYGVLAQGVAQRTSELGVRMALGARARDVVRLVLDEALALVGVGTVLGVAGALLATRLLRGLLFGVAPADVPTFVLVVVVLVGAGLLAGGIPALRAARLPPSVALRSE